MKYQNTGNTWEEEGNEKSSGPESREGEEVRCPVAFGDKPLAEDSNLAV